MADTTNWKVAGKLGELGDAPLGTEVLLVLRCTVARLADVLEDGVEVRTATVKPTAAARLGSRSTLATQVAKLLADTNAQLL